MDRTCASVCELVSLHVRVRVARAIREKPINEFAHYTATACARTLRSSHTRRWKLELSARARGDWKHYTCSSRAHVYVYENIHNIRSVVLYVCIFIQISLQRIVENARKLWKCEPLCFME